MDEVGCPEPAAVLHRMLSTRSCCASSCHWAAVVAGRAVSVTMVESLLLPMIANKSAHILPGLPQERAAHHRERTMPESKAVTTPSDRMAADEKEFGDDLRRAP